MNKRWECQIIAKTGIKSANIRLNPETGKMKGVMK
jgi:hypothetical protein